MASTDELKLMAVRTERRTVVLHFSPQQLTERRKLITDLAIELMKEEDAWREIRTEHEAKVKPLKEKLSLTAREVHRGFEETEAECYLVPDQESGRMDYVLEDGTIAFSRPLYPEERQLNLLTKQKDTAS